MVGTMNKNKFLRGFNKSITGIHLKYYKSNMINQFSKYVKYVKMYAIQLANKTHRQLLPKLNVSFIKESCNS